MTIRTILVGAALALSVPALAQEKPVDISAIPNVIAGDAEWQMAWSGPMTADGMATAPDGNLLFAQEQSNAIWKLWPDGQAFVEVAYVLGAGAVSVDTDGSLFVAERGCTDPGLGGLSCDRFPSVKHVGEVREVVAEFFEDGTSIGRVNDVQADGRGGAWFTQGNLYYTNDMGEVSTVYEAQAFTNGVALSPDSMTLYVTDMRKIVAFDVDLDNGSTSNQRDFATLSKDTAGFGGDGMTVDRNGRLYVTGDAGVYVFTPDGTELGVIPVPRRSITLAFAGTDRNVLYVGAMGATTPAGDEWATPEGIRNVAMTIYRVNTLAQGL